MSLDDHVVGLCMLAGSKVGVVDDGVESPDQKVLKLSW